MLIVRRTMFLSLGRLLAILGISHYFRTVIVFDIILNRRNKLYNAMCLKMAEKAPSRQKAPQKKAPATN